MANVAQEITLKDAEIYIGGVRVAGVREFNYKVMQEHENVHGLGGVPISQGSGTINFEGEVKLLRSAYLDLLERVPRGSYITQLRLDVVQSQFDSSRGKQITTRALSCLIKEADVQQKFDEKFGEVTLPLVIGDIQTTFD